ncbi:Synembryn-A [Galemys pyrenaicus]|uniref:Synembryn n=1 Tax=Galemys pyrenaicus TaxID=202257 RepID=A0A8J6DRJ8_GALPY|nr:Synembryn-A [Galemys pyrenaicus]
MAPAAPPASGLPGVSDVAPAPRTSGTPPPRHAPSGTSPGPLSPLKERVAMPRPRRPARTQRTPRPARDAPLARSACPVPRPPAPPTRSAGPARDARPRPHAAHAPSHDARARPHAAQATPGPAGTQRTPRPARDATHARSARPGSSRPPPRAHQGGADGLRARNRSRGASAALPRRRPGTMEPRAVADAVATGDQDAALEALRTYNREVRARAGGGGGGGRSPAEPPPPQNSQSFTFDDSQREDRERLAELLVAVLERGLPPACRVAWLQSVRILSRDHGCLERFTGRRSLQALARHAGIAAADGAGREPPDMDVVLESLKCLCNLVLSSPAAQVLAAEARLVVRLAERVGQGGLPHEVRFFDLRLLFLLTALRTDVRRQLFQELRGVRLLTDALELTLGGRPRESPPELLPPQETEQAMEILKVLFNITFDSVKREVEEEDAALYRHLGTLLRHCVILTAAGDRTEELHGHTVNLMGNLPLNCLGVLLTLEPHEGSLEFLGVNMDVIQALLNFLEKRLQQVRGLTAARQPARPRPLTRPLQTHRLKESVAPVLSVLTECARLHRPARKFLKAQVLPPLRDVRTRPEVGELLRNKLVRLMTHLDTDVKRVAAEFLFVLCSESVPRFIKYTGYGNAAGLLAARGLMAGGRPEGQYSEDEDTDTEEYKEAKASINPVTGRVEEKPPNPMEGMTEEQKEYEAMKLVNMFDKLSRHRVIQPVGMSPRGQLTSLQDAMCESMEGQLSSDPDSDPD